MYECVCVYMYMCVCIYVYSVIVEWSVLAPSGKTALWLRLSAPVQAHWTALLFQHCKTFIQYTHTMISEKQVYKEGFE